MVGTVSVPKKVGVGHISPIAFLRMHIIFSIFSGKESPLTQRAAHVRDVRFHGPIYVLTVVHGIFQVHITP